jgi:hypothetical protein
MNTLFLLEFLIFDGAALTWAGYELWSVRRSKWEADAKDEKPSKEAPRHPER